MFVHAHNIAMQLFAPVGSSSQLFIINITGKTCTKLPFEGTVAPICVGLGSDSPYFRNTIVIAGVVIEVWGSEPAGTNVIGDVFIRRYAGLRCFAFVVALLSCGCCMCCRYSGSHLKTSEPSACMEVVWTASPATQMEASGVVSFFDWNNSISDSSVFDVPSYC
jgi:hypothetical protein